MTATSLNTSGLLPSFLYYVVAHFHFILSLGAVIGFFCGVIFNGEKIIGSKNLLPSSSSFFSLYHLVSTFIGILLTFSPMHFLGFNVMQRRIPDFPDSFHSWNFLSSIGSGITFLSFAIFFLVLISVSFHNNFFLFQILFFFFLNFFFLLFLFDFSFLFSYESLDNYSYDHKFLIPKICLLILTKRSQEIKD